MSIGTDSDSSGYPTQSLYDGVGTTQEQGMAAGYPFPAVGGNLDLDQGWNWFGIEAPTQ